MNGFNDDELAKKVSEAMQSRGGKPAKYPQLKKYEVNILQLIEKNVQLPFILKWLIEDKNENLVLNTLRKYVVREIGRPAYEEYLKRNGWMKNKKTAIYTPQKSADKLVQAEVKAIDVGMKEKLKQNPLHALSVEPKEGEHNPLPQHRFELDVS